MTNQAAGRYLHIYCDESRQTADRYIVIGGIIVPRMHEARVQLALQSYRTDNQMNAELKWTKVSDQKLTEYRRFVDLFFSLSSIIYFKAIVVDTSEIDHKRYNKNNPELGFYKLMYQFLLHSFGQELRPGDRCTIHLDQRTTKRYKLSTLCAILNNGLRKKYRLEDKPIRNVQAVDSKSNDFIQLADVLMGAIGYEMNGAHTRTNAKRAKIHLAEHIAQSVGIINLQQPTPRRQRHFSIWHFHFRAAGG